MRNFHETAMRTVTIEKARLITKLIENKLKHQRAFDAAMTGYWQALANALRSMQDRVSKRDTSLKHQIELVRPVSHAEEYDSAIEMLQWETRDTIELSTNDFHCYVMDKWDWRDDFDLTYSTYAVQ